MDTTSPQWALNPFPPSFCLHSLMLIAVQQLALVTTFVITGCKNQTRELNRFQGSVLLWKQLQTTLNPLPWRSYVNSDWNRVRKPGENTCVTNLSLPCASQESPVACEATEQRGPLLSVRVDFLTDFLESHWGNTPSLSINQGSGQLQDKKKINEQTTHVVLGCICVRLLPLYTGVWSLVTLGLGGGHTSHCLPVL